MQNSSDKAKCKTSVVSYVKLMPPADATTAVGLLLDIIGFLMLFLAAPEKLRSLARIKFLCFEVLSHIGIVTTKVEMDAPSLYRNEFYGDWSYEPRP